MKSRSGAPFGGVYDGAKVLVTGHTGFKGSWLCLWLKALGADVVGYSIDPPSTPSNFEAVRLEESVEHVHGDVRDPAALSSVFNRCKPRVVFHLAAQSLVRRSYRMPGETFETNVQGTLNVLEATRSCSAVKSLVLVTSDKCYRVQEGTSGYREEDPLGGGDPYSASKAMAELAITAYRESFFQRPGSPGVASARAGNAIAGGDFGEDRLVPDGIRALAAGKPFEVRNPAAIRPWQFVLEPLGGYLTLGWKLLEDPENFSGPWNFGPREEEVATGDVADRLVRLWGEGTWKAVADRTSLPEAHRLQLSWEKAKARLAWRPLYSLDRALEETVAWYKAFHEADGPRSMDERCDSQIRRYMEEARTQD